MKRVLITGVSSGIGEATCKLLIERGFEVIGCSRKKPAFPVKWHFIDLASDISIYKFVNWLMAEEKTVDILINNAGTGSIAPFDALSISKIRALFNINFSGHVLLTQKLITMGLLKEKIINVSSLAAVIPLPFRGFYSATKSALLSISLTMRIELEKLNIDVCCLLPGDVKTNIHQNRIEADLIERLSLYPELHKVKDKIDREENEGVNPQVIASEIYSLIKKKRMPPVKICGKFAQKIYYYLWNTLPLSISLKLLKKHYEI